MWRPLLPISNARLSFLLLAVMVLGLFGGCVQHTHHHFTRTDYNTTHQTVVHTTTTVVEVPPPPTSPPLPSGLRCPPFELPPSRPMPTIEEYLGGRTLPLPEAEIAIASYIRALQALIAAERQAVEQAQREQLRRCQ